MKIKMLLAAAVVALGVLKMSGQEISVTPLINQGKEIPENFMGLSYETKTTVKRTDGSFYFDSHNKALVNIFKTLNIQSLRIGGNSVDANENPIPNNADIDQLFRFARKAGSKIIYSVRLENGDVDIARQAAKHIYENYRDVIDCFAIGNEPYYYRDFEKKLLPRWTAIYEGMKTVAPGVPFCAIDQNPGKEWYENTKKYLYTPNGPATLYTVHNYPGGCAYKNSNAKTIAELIPHDAADRRDLMLSEKMQKSNKDVYERLQNIFEGAPYRMTETNNYWYGGLKDASDSYASALWALDYTWWWAMHDVKGMNFHTGDSCGGGTKIVVSRYAAFVTDRDGYEIRPLSYALKLFDLGAKGKFIPMEKSEDDPNIAVYGSKEGKYLYITIINKSHDENGQTKHIRLNEPKGYKWNNSFRQIVMKAPGNDIARKDGITIGGSSITKYGQWKGRWEKKKVEKDNGLCVAIAPAQAMVLKLTVAPNP